MKIEELVVLLPCHSLEDFPTHHEGEEAEGLLGAWSAMWHPKLIASCGKAPTWSRADAPPENLKRKLIVIPQISESLLLTGWPTRAKTEGARIIRKTTKRADIVSAALAIAAEPEPAGAATPAPLPDAPPQVAEIPADLVADFLALGTCYLLVELLTRQMRYMSNLDEVHFQNEAVAGALAAAEGREDDARTHLRSAFESLYEARERFYPVDNYLIDLTLTADTTLGPSLRRELDGDAPMNLLITGKLLDLMAEKHPETLPKLRHALDRGTLSIVGGEYDERESTLLGPEAVLADFRRGRAAYERAFGKAPDVYGRRRQGLSPLVPSITARDGYEGAIGFTLDDGRFPSSDSPKTRWEGLDASAIDTLTRTPLDANVAASFLDLPRKVGESMDRDFVATLVFAHWPGAVSPYYEDLRRITAYVPVLGKFKTLSDYFQNTERPGSLNRFSPDKYRTTFLRQSIVRNLPNPITWVGDAIRRRLMAESNSTLRVMTDAITLKADPTAGNAATELLARVDDESTAALDVERAKALTIEVATALAAAGAANAATLAGTQQSGNGILVVNTHLAARRELVDVSSLDELPTIGGQVAAAQATDAAKHAVVDVPALGFVWLSAGAAVPKPRKPPKPLVNENVLRNDLIEVHVSRKTGGLQGFFSHTIRGNRLSQQLAFRFPSPRQKPGDLWRDPDLEPIYSTMVCDRFETTIAGPALSEITTGGLLLDAEGKPVAKFTQRFRLAQGSPLATIDMELDITEQPRAEAWGSYYAARFAWPDESTAMGRGAFLTHQPTKSKQPESPYFLELETETTSTLIFPCGLPHHLLTGERMVDTLLIGKGETRRKFRFVIGAEIEHPSAVALDTLEELVIGHRLPRPSSGETGWLFHLDVKNVVATHWESLVDAGRVIGFRVRLLETEGLTGRIHLRTLRKLTSARQIDHREQTLVDLTPDDDKLGFEIGAYEWLELEARY